MGTSTHSSAASVNLPSPPMPSIVGGEAPSQDPNLDPDQALFGSSFTQHAPFDGYGEYDLASGFSGGLTNEKEIITYTKYPGHHDAVLSSRASR